MRNKRKLLKIYVPEKYDPLQLVRMFAFDDRDKKWTERRWRTITLAKAQRKVDQGELQPVKRLYGGMLQVVGYQALEPIRTKWRSASTLTLRTMECVAGEVSGAGATAEVDRYTLWPWIGDDKAVAVRPIASEAHRKRAQALWRQGMRHQVRTLSRMMSAA